MEELMKHIIKKSDYLRKKGIDTNRMRLTVGTAKGRAITDKRMQVSKFFTEAERNEEIVLVFKDLGPQISWQLVFVVEYFGPILIAAMISMFQKQIYGRSEPYNFNQKIGIGMFVGHYLKREVETLFVHRFGNDTMPLFNLFKNSFHYWVLSGLGIMFFLQHPDYTSPSWASEQTIKILVGVFCFCEFMNLMCHITLRNLRKPGTKERGIPRGWGFQLVSCANYFWESMSWLVFAITTQVAGAWLFWVVSTGQMIIWALKKHSAYRKDFGDKYPRIRKAMFPFFI